MREAFDLTRITPKKFKAKAFFIYLNVEKLRKKLQNTWQIGKNSVKYISITN